MLYDILSVISSEMLKMTLSNQELFMSYSDADFQEPLIFTMLLLGSPVNFPQGIGLFEAPVDFAVIHKSLSILKPIF